MSFGDGDGINFSSFAKGLDVIAHELTHGITQYTANLVYYGQSGALNEHISDFFAAMVDRNNWLIGEDIVTPNIPGDALRDMENPASNKVAFNEQQPTNMSEYQNLPLNEQNDYGGVHINEGITNRASVFLADSIGKDKAEKIYYYALTNYLFRNAQFIDLRYALKSSAEDLYGKSSMEASVVDYSFDAVGITQATFKIPQISKAVSPITGPQYIAYISTSDLGYIWVKSIDRTINKRISARRIYNSNGDFGKISVMRNGEEIWYIDENGHLSYIDIRDLNNVKDSSYPNFYLYKAGDLQNCCISPDGLRVALVSNYSPDPHIYFYDFSKTIVYTLKTPTDAGLLAGGPEYPDVLDFAPDGNLLAYDAFYAYGDTSLGGYWNINEIDADSNIYSLLPTPSYPYLIGNPQYSSTNPQEIAFNEIDITTGAEYLGIWFVDSLNNQQNFELNITGERPTFSPDNSKLAYTAYDYYPFGNAYIFIGDFNKFITQGVWSEANFINNGIHAEWFARESTLPNPSKPQWVSISSDSNKVVLKWKKNGESDIYYYKIYRGTQSQFVPNDSLNYIKTIDRADTFYTDTGVDVGTTYYYKIVAVDTRNYKSVPSDAIGVIVVSVELISFSGDAVDNSGKVELCWTTLSEINNLGFEVERSFDGEKFEKIGFVQGNVTTVEQHDYKFTDEIGSIREVYYRLKQVDFDGSFHYSEILKLAVNTPKDYVLYQNYPNPFNGETIIKYQIPKDSFVRIEIFNLLGEKIKTLVNEQEYAGYYSIRWDGTNYNNLVTGSGIYIYRIEAGNFVKSMKLILLK